MAHISQIGLKNFRLFKNTAWTYFDLSLFNIITGPNNSGKSSLIKSLLLMNDNREKNNFFDIDFSGEKHKLDSFDFAFFKSSTISPDLVDAATRVTF